MVAGVIEVYNLLDNIRHEITSWKSNNGLYCEGSHSSVAYTNASNKIHFAIMTLNRGEVLLFGGSTFCYVLQTINNVLLSQLNHETI